MSISGWDPIADGVADISATASDGTTSGGDDSSGQFEADNRPTFDDVMGRFGLPTTWASMMEFGSGMPRRSRDQMEAQVERGDVPDGSGDRDD